MANLGVHINSGLRMGVNIFGHRNVPIESEEHRPTENTMLAMEETISDIKNGNAKVFYNVDEFMNDLLAD